MAKGKLTYEKAIQEIEEITHQIENQELNVDTLSLQVKRVAELIRFCKSMLHGTAEDVEKILKDIEI